MRSPGRGTAWRVVALFEQHAAELDRAFPASPVLSPFFGAPADGVALPVAYCASLKVTEAYVRWTVPMLRAASVALRSGDGEGPALEPAARRRRAPGDRRDVGGGHDVWAADDMRAVGAPDGFIAAPPPDAGRRDGEFMIDDAGRHPYGTLGAKGVLEHLAITVAEDFRIGLLRSGIANIENGVRFVSSHGTLDVEHVRDGDAVIRSLTSPEKLQQVADGTAVTRDAYRAFLDAMAELHDEWAPRWQS